MKMLRLWGFAFVGYFYTAFVLQMLWNWFAAPVFRLNPIGYWQMYGLHMLMMMVLQRNSYEENDHWKRALLMVYASVRPENKAEVDELTQMKESEYVEAGLMMAGMVLMNTITLGIGSVLHAFLA